MSADANRSLVMITVLRTCGVPARGEPLSRRRDLVKASEVAVDLRKRGSISSPLIDACSSTV